MLVAFTLHTLAAVIWVGGMFFAYMALRPVAASLFEPPARLNMWSQVFARFFPWVWLSVIVLLVTGLWIIKLYGGMGSVGIHIHTMFLLGLVMMLLFMHLFFNPYKKLNQAIGQQDWEFAGKQLGRIRHIIAVNLSLGLIVVAIAVGGRYI